MIKLRSHLKTFSNKERAIASYILEHGPAVSTTTIGAMAETLDLSPGSIVGFCKKLGFKGFQELKQVLSTASAERQDLPVLGSLPADTIVANTFRNAAMTVEDTLKINPMNSFDKASEWIVSASRVEFFGIGGSARIAENATRKFVRFKPSVAFHSDSQQQLRSAQTMDSDCVGIGISYSGETRQIVACLESAKANGAETIAITSSERSSLCEFADIVFLSAIRGHEMFSENEFTKIGQAVILDALYYCFVNKLDTDQVIQAGLKTEHFDSRAAARTSTQKQQAAPANSW